MDITPPPLLFSEMKYMSLYVAETWGKTQGGKTRFVNYGQGNGSACRNVCFHVGNEIKVADSNASVLRQTIIFNLTGKFKCLRM